MGHKKCKWLQCQSNRERTSDRLIWMLTKRLNECLSNLTTTKSVTLIVCWLNTAAYTHLDFSVCVFLARGFSYETSQPLEGLTKWEQEVISNFTAYKNCKTHLICTFSTEACSASWNCCRNPDAILCSLANSKTQDVLFPHSPWRQHAKNVAAVAVNLGHLFSTSLPLKSHRMMHVWINPKMKNHNS